MRANLLDEDSLRSCMGSDTPLLCQPAASPPSVRSAFASLSRASVVPPARRGHKRLIYLEKAGFAARGGNLIDPILWIGGAPARRPVRAGRRGSSLPQKDRAPGFCGLFPG